MNSAANLLNIVGRVGHRCIPPVVRRQQHHFRKSAKLHPQQSGPLVNAMSFSSIGM